MSDQRNVKTTVEKIAEKVDEKLDEGKDEWAELAGVWKFLWAAPGLINRCRE